MRTPNGPKSSGSAHSILPCARDAKSLHEERLLIFFLDCYELAEMERPFFILKGRLDSNLILRLPFFCNLAPLLESSCTMYSSTLLALHSFSLENLRRKLNS